jgi:hypothetical protein
LAQRDREIAGFKVNMSEISIDDSGSAYPMTELERLLYPLLLFTVVKVHQDSYEISLVIELLQES